MNNPNIPKINKENLSQDEIANNIISKMEIEEYDERYDNVNNYIFHYGGKKLVLTHFLDRRDKDFSTYIECISPEKREKDETTLLYMAAKKIMQRIANQKKKNLVYEILTESKSMRKWAQDSKKGRGLFNWEQEDVDKNEAYPDLYSFRTTIVAKK